MSAHKPISNDSFNCRKTLNVDGKSYVYYSLPDAEANGLTGISQLPYSMKVLLENLLRHEDGRSVTKADIAAMASWLDNKGKTEKEIALPSGSRADAGFHRRSRRRRSRRDARRHDEARRRSDRRSIRSCPVDLVIDHSVIVDEFGTPKALAETSTHEYARNGERYNFLKWGQGAFENFRVVPPGTGICHQVNLEYLRRRFGPARRPTAQTSPIPTRSSAPTAIRRWSMDLPCSVGASAASRPRLRCSVSRFRC